MFAPMNLSHVNKNSKKANQKVDARVAGQMNPQMTLNTTRSRYHICKYGGVPNLSPFRPMTSHFELQDILTQGHRMAPK